MNVLARLAADGAGDRNLFPVLAPLAALKGIPLLTTAAFLGLRRNASGSSVIAHMPNMEVRIAEWELLLSDLATNDPACTYVADAGVR